MPGEDFAESLRMVAELTPDLIALPELPGRGTPAGMTGRGLAVLSGLGADIVPEGWRLTSSKGLDQRRARSLLAQDLDSVEEQLEGFDGVFKAQVAGPLTLAATVERPQGDRVLADHGLRRELTESLAEGLRDHVADLRRRLPLASIVVQVDEPALQAVLAGSIPTASGWGRHRTVHPPEVDASLRMVVDAIVESGARAVAHTCAPDVPIALLANAGFSAISFDLDLAVVQDAWAEVYEQGVDLWPGVVPTAETTGLADKVLIARLDTFFGALGFATETYAPRLVVTPTCGLAGATPGWARRALELCQSVAVSLS
ncbi:methionine synthase [soil metagenome]